MSTDTVPEPATIDRKQRNKDAQVTCILVDNWCKTFEHETLWKQTTSLPMIFKRPDFALETNFTEKMRLMKCGDPPNKPHVVILAWNPELDHVRWENRVKNFLNRRIDLPFTDVACYMLVRAPSFQSESVRFEYANENLIAGYDFWNDENDYVETPLLLSQVLHRLYGNKMSLYFRPITSIQGFFVNRMHVYMMLMTILCGLIDIPVEYVLRLISVIYLSDAMEGYPLKVVFILIIVRMMYMIAQNPLFFI